MHSLAGFLSLALAAFTGSDDGYHDPTPPERAVLGRYLEAARALDRKYEHVSGTAVLLGRYGASPSEPSGRAAEIGRRLTFSRDGATAVVLSKWFDTKTGAPLPQERVMGMNPDYAFFLTKNPPGSPAAYTILGLGKDDHGKSALSFQRFCFDFLDATRGTFCGKSSDVFSNPKAKVKSVEAVDLDGKACYKIEYRHAPSPANTLYPTGWVIVSPGEGWVVKEYLCRAEESYPSIHGKVFYRAAGPGGDVTPSEVVISFGAMPQRFKVEALNFAPMDESHCHIARYGFPEDLAYRRNRAAGYGVPWFMLALCGLGVSVTLSRVFRDTLRKAGRVGEGPPLPTAGAR